jgi:hypothetical protein
MTTCFGLFTLIRPSTGQTRLPKEESQSSIVPVVAIGVTYRNEISFYLKIPHSQRSCFPQSSQRWTHNNPQQNLRYHSEHQFVTPPSPPFSFYMVHELNISPCLSTCTQRNPLHTLITKYFHPETFFSLSPIMDNHSHHTPLL